MLRVELLGLKTIFLVFFVRFSGENLSNKDPQIQEKAVAAMPHFLTEYLMDPETNEFLKEKRDDILKEFLGV